MCISVKELDERVVSIREFKSIKKDVDVNLKPLEKDVKEFMEENGHTKYIGYGYSISYEEQKRESVIKEKVMELLNNPKVMAAIREENIDTACLFKTTVVRPLRIS